MILHIDMDAFFASIEQAVNPRLKGKPLIVGSRPSRMHTVVCAASYEAKAQGIDSGMASAEAFKICPSLEFVAAQQGKYIWTSEQIYELLKERGFALSYASIDEFRMDIINLPEPQALAKDIQEQIYANFNITASIGIAKNSLLAKLASKLKKPKGLLELTEANLISTLANTPVGKLCGIGVKSQELLAGLGIETCLDLYEKTPDFLRRTFGKNGIELYASLHANEGFQETGEPDILKSVGHSYTLPVAVKTPGFIRAWLRVLSEMVATRLRQQNLVSRSVHLWLNCPQTGNFGAQETFSQATNDGYEICQRSLKIMAKLLPKQAKIRALGVTCQGLSKQAYCQPLLKEEIRRGALLAAQDRINSRFGEQSICPALTLLARKLQ